MLRHVAPERPAASRCFLSTDAVDTFVYTFCRQSVYTHCRHRMSMLFDQIAESMTHASPQVKLGRIYSDHARLSYGVHFPAK